jgi:alkylated DNA nucleotide flippase Atl1
MSPFLRAVRRVVRGIPRGTTLSYGEVALRAGKPGAPRAVVAALHSLTDVPWWRVARRDGTLAPQVAHQQAVLLRQEGWKPRRQGGRRR